MPGSPLSSRREGSLILCYHGVSEGWPSEAAIAPAALRRQLAHLLGRGYRALTLSAAIADPEPGKTLVVTFDDAHRSVAELAFPILTSLGVPATLFVPTDFADEQELMTWSTLGRWVGTEHEAELRCMGWDRIRELAGAGWEIGSHTCTHPDLTAISPAEAEGELRRSREECEARLQRACGSLAYPFGRCDAGVAELARSAGYGQAVTLGSRAFEPLRFEPLELSRIGVYRSTGWAHFVLATSRATRRFRASRAYRRLAPP